LVDEPSDHNMFGCRLVMKTSDRSRSLSHVIRSPGVYRESKVLEVGRNPSPRKLLYCHDGFDLGDFCRRAYSGFYWDSIAPKCTPELCLAHDVRDTHMVGHCWRHTTLMTFSGIVV
jgi:hypothetical protein